MFVFKKILAAYLLPPFGLIPLALLGVLLARRWPRFGRSLALASLAAVVVLSFPWCGNALLASLERYPPVAPRDLAHAQAIVVLGGGLYPAAPEYGADTVSSASLVRARYAVQLQRRSGLPILASGGTVYGGTPEARAIKALVQRELGGQVRWSEESSRDTAENAVFSAVQLKRDGVTRIALVSHAWHLPRAVELFERQGLTVYPAPTAFATNYPDGLARFLPSAAALANSGTAVHEWVGILVQRMTTGF